MLGFCSSGEHFLFSFLFFKFFKTIIIFFYIYSFVCLSYCSFPLTLNININKSSLSTSVKLCICILSFFSFIPLVSKCLLVLFSLLYSPIGTLLQFCFPVCALVSFVLVDISFGSLCLLGISIVHYFHQTALILLMGVYVYVYIQ